MANFITFTPHPITVSLPGPNKAHHISQPLWSVIDVARFDTLDLELGVLFLTGDVTANVFIDTSMQNQTDGYVSGAGDSEWYVVGQFAAVKGASNALSNPQWQKLHIGPQDPSQGLLRFARWRVALSSPGTATFFIRGIARQTAR